jgi:hypothetical protein
MARDRSQPSFVLNRCPVCGRVTGVLTRQAHGAVTHERCDGCVRDAPSPGEPPGPADAPEPEATA